MTTPQPPPASTLPPETCPHCGWPKVERNEYDEVRDYNCGSAFSMKKGKLTVLTGVCEHNAMKREIAALRADKERLESFLATVMHNFDGIPTLAPNGGGAVAPSSQGTALIPRDEHDAICERLRTELAAANEIACTHRDEAAGLRAQVAQLRGALEGLIDAVGSVQDWSGTHTGQWLDKAEAALASDGSELLTAIRDLLERADHVSRHLGHKGSSKQFLDRAIKNCAALANLNSAIGEVSHE